MSAFLITAVVVVALVGSSTLTARAQSHAACFFDPAPAGARASTPEEQLAVDRLLDMSRTAVNVLGEIL